MANQTELFAFLASCLLSPVHNAETDVTQLSSWVSSASPACIEFATSSRRLSTDLEKLNTAHFKSRWVVSGGVYSPVGSRDRVSNSAANSTGWILNMFSFQFFYQVRRELVANSIHTADATQLDSWVVSASAACIGYKTTEEKQTHFATKSMPSPSNCIIWSAIQVQTSDQAYCQTDFDQRLVESGFFRPRVGVKSLLLQCIQRLK